MIPVTRTDLGYLRFHQTELVPGYTYEGYDISLIVPSFESRCMDVLPFLRDSKTRFHVLEFQSQITSSITDRLRSNLSSITRNFDYTLVDDSSTDTSLSSFSALGKVISTEAQSARRPISVFADLSCLPAPYAMFLVGFCFTNGLISKVTFFYSVADYMDATVDERYVRGSISTGDWSIVEIPYLDRGVKPFRSRRLLACVGFEGSSIRKFLRRLESNDISIVTPDPGFHEMVTVTARSESDLICREFSVPPECRHSVGAADAARIAVITDRWLSERMTGNELILAALGTKPHAVGLAAASVGRGVGSVLSYMPHKRSFVDRTGVGAYYGFTIDDPTA